jgi:hypothetical protein
MLTAGSLNRFAFYSLFENSFSVDDGRIGSREDLTDYVCETRFTETNEVPIKLAFCARSYRKMPRLYDVSIVAATLDANDRGLVTSMMLGGFSFENAIQIAQRHLEVLSWAK